MMIHLIASGEAGGRLEEEMLARSANNQEREVNGLISTLLGILQPMLIVMMGAVVMVIVLVIIMIVVITAFISMLIMIIGMNLSIEMFSLSPHQSGTDGRLKRQSCAVA